MLRSNFKLGKNYFTEDSVAQDLSEFNQEIIRDLTPEQKFFLLTALEPGCNPYLVHSQTDKRHGKFFVDKDQLESVDVSSLESSELSTYQTHDHSLEKSKNKKIKNKMKYKKRKKKSMQNGMPSEQLNECCHDKKCTIF